MFNLPKEKFYRAFDTETNSFYTTSKGKTFFSSVGHIKSSIRQRYGTYKFSYTYLPDDFIQNRFKLIEYTCDNVVVKEFD